MHTGNHYKITEFLYWTRRDIYLLIILATVPTVLYQVYDITWIAIPWVPVALIGTAGAFMIGFKNTQSYNRLWEARQIWGAIVNASREFSYKLRDFSGAPQEELQEIYYRHIAWLTALRYQLREPRTWEHSNTSYNKEFRKFYSVPEWEGRLDSVLETLLSKEELKALDSKKNKASWLMNTQSAHLTRLHKEGHLDVFKYVELERLLGVFTEQQGKCERIKNFPYPRQYASINMYLVWLMVILLPFGMLSEFSKLGECYVWFAIPFSVIVSWAFTSMEKIGEASENPFEGSANDIPMASISRNIEIEYRELLNETNIPEPIAPVNKIIL